MAMTKKYYYLHFVEDEGSIAVSLAEPPHEIVETKNGDVIKFSVDGEFVEDYLANDLGWPLMSLKMKSVIDKFCAPHENQLSWQPASVTTDRGETIRFYIPKFLGDIDVIDREKSKVIDGTLGEMIIKACLSLDKVKKLDFFPLPKSEIRLIVSDNLKKEIEKHQLSGVDFSKALTA